MFVFFFCHILSWSLRGPATQPLHNEGRRPELKTPCVHAHIWSKKRQFCQIYTLWPKKWIGCHFFGYFTKHFCSNAHIFSTKKKRPFSKKTLLSCPYFVEKMSILSETVLLCQCFQNFHQKPLAVMPIFDQKRQFYQNYTILWAKNQ